VLVFKHHITKAHSIIDLRNGWSLEVSIMLWLLYSQGKSSSTQCIRVIKKYGIIFCCIITSENLLLIFFTVQCADHCSTVYTKESVTAIFHFIPRLINKQTL